MAIYKPEVVEQYINELLDTKLAVEVFVEDDRTLLAQPGDTVKVYRYTDSGSAEVVSEGAGNTNYSDLDGTPTSYTVKVVQDRCKVTDEEVARNPFVAEKKLDVVGAHIINKLRADVVGEWQKSTNKFEVADTKFIPTFTELMSALSQLDLGVDGGANGLEEDYRIFCSPDAWNAFCGKLASNVMIQYDMVNGKRMPIINGIAVEITDLMKNTTTTKCSMLIATNKAVRLVHGKSVAAESEREANTRTSIYYGRDNYVAALEFNNKVVRFTHTGA